MIKLVSKKTSELTLEKIKSICLLKKTHWKYNLKSQLTWFKNNILPPDIHNMLLIDNKLVGYTCLRVIKNNSYDKKKYLLFDTLIIKKEFRKKYFKKKSMSYLIMRLNDKVIKKSKKTSFLICKKELVKFYKKHKWFKISNRTRVKKNRIPMIFNYRKNDISFFINSI